MRRPSIGCFGLGTMGWPIASHLARAGFEVAVADARESVAQQWRAQHPSGTHGAHTAEVVITCVTDESALERLLLGADGLLRDARAGQLFIDHTTTSPRLARAAGECAEQCGAHFVDAPLSGAAIAAQAGTLAVFAGGSADALARASELMRHYAQRITPLGGVGAGQTGKLANQVAIAGTVRGLTEAVALARGAGLDIDALLGALGAGSARSNQLEQHAAKLCDPLFAFGMTFDWLDKDLRLALDEAATSGTPLPQTELIRKLLQP